jgi:TPR repeat protein
MFRLVSLYRVILAIVFVAILTPSCGGASHKNIDKHIQEIRERAEKGFAAQQVELAVAYLTGDGVAQDLKESAHWYEQAAKRGNPEAQNQIGYFYEHGIGVAQDEVRAAHWYQLSSAGGLAWGKMNLGVAYLKGLGVRKNVTTGAQLLEEATAQGLGLAATYRGMIEYLGLRNGVDLAAAEKWFETGAKLHDPVAACSLGYVYSQQAGHPHDVERAVSYARYAARRGYVPGKQLLGWLLVNHPELAQADGEAREAVEEASSQGNWRSTVLLGVLARDGKNAAADQGQAYFYFRLSVLQGGEAAKRLVGNDLRTLEAQLSREEQKQIAAKAAERQRQHPDPIMFLVQANDADSGFRMMAVPDPASRLAGE